MKLFLTLALLAMLAMPALAADAMKSGAKADEGIARTNAAFFAAWNIHDVDTMTGFWSDDATLINPVGRVAHGRSEIHDLLNSEQTGIFKSSKVTVNSFSVTRMVGAAAALCDGELTVDGAVGPDGSALPQMNVHLILLMEKQGSRWVVTAARPCTYPPPPGKPAGN